MYHISLLSSRGQKSRGRTTESSHSTDIERTGLRSNHVLFRGSFVVDGITVEAQSTTCLSLQISGKGFVVLKEFVRIAVIKIAEKDKEVRDCIKNTVDDVSPATLYIFTYNPLCSTHRNREFCLMPFFKTIMKHDGCKHNIIAGIT